MKLCYLGNELTGIWSCGNIHIVKISQDEVFLLYAVMILSPSSWLWHESWYQSMDGRCAMKLTLGQSSCTLSCRALPVSTCIDIGPSGQRLAHLDEISLRTSIWQNDRHLCSLRPSGCTRGLCRDNLCSSRHDYNIGFTFS